MATPEPGARVTFPLTAHSSFPPLFCRDTALLGCTTSPSPARQPQASPTQISAFSVQGAISRVLAFTLRDVEAAPRAHNTLPRYLAPAVPGDPLAPGGGHCFVTLDSRGGRGTERPERNRPRSCSALLPGGAGVGSPGLDLSAVSGSMSPLCCPLLPPHCGRMVQSWRRYWGKQEADCTMPHHPTPCQPGETDVLQACRKKEGLGVIVCIFPAPYQVLRSWKKETLLGILRHRPLQPRKVEGQLLCQGHLLSPPLTPVPAALPSTLAPARNEIWFGGLSLGRGEEKERENHTRAGQIEIRIERLVERGRCTL